MREHVTMPLMQVKNVMRKILVLSLLGTVVTGLLSGCTTGPSDPLLDAPLGQRTICTAVRPVQGSDALSVIPFNCPDLDISATLNELRDAGWRLETVYMGEDVKVNDTLASEVSISVRKAY